MRKLKNVIEVLSLVLITWILLASTAYAGHETNDKETKVSAMKIGAGQKGPVRITITDTDGLYWIKVWETDPTTGQILPGGERANTGSGPLFSQGGTRFDIDVPEGRFVIQTMDKETPNGDTHNWVVDTRPTFSVPFGLPEAKPIGDYGSWPAGNCSFPPSPPIPAASISPMSASILVGQSITFTSTALGKCPPYSYLWYVDGTLVSGAVLSNWTFMPTTSGVYYVYVEITDITNNITDRSETARTAVTAVPVGGYSVTIGGYPEARPLPLYLALVGILATALISIKRKIRKET